MHRREGAAVALRSLHGEFRIHADARDLGPLNSAGWILATPRLPLEVGTGFDRQRLVIDLAFDVARGLQDHLLATNRSHHLPTYDDHVGNDATRDPAVLSNHYDRTMDVTLHVTFNMDLALANEVPEDH
jgi:hypothetical protein